MSTKQVLKRPLKYKDIKVMKEVLKYLANLLPHTFEEKADEGLKSNNKVELKQQEMLPTSIQLENSANRSLYVQILPQTVHTHQTQHKP